MQSASPGTRSGETEMASDWAHRRRRESLARGRKNGRTEMMRLLPPHLVKQDEHPAKPEPRGFEDDNGSPRSESGCEYTKPDAPCPTWPRSAMSACEAHNGGTRVRTYRRRASECPAAADNLETFPLKSTDPPSPLALRRTDERGMSVRVLLFTMSAKSCN